MGKSTIFMAIFNSYVKLPEGKLRYVEILAEFYGLPQVHVWFTRDEPG
jgi:hypothetical protein